MKRFTTDTPESNMQSAYNLFYIKDQETWVRGGGPEPDYADISLYDFMRRLIEIHNLEIDTSSNENMGDNLYELLFDNVDTLEGVAALLYASAWAFSVLREELKAYEDTGLNPEEITDGKLLTGWIPVSERLPGTTMVIGCNKWGNVQPVLYMSNANRWVIMPNGNIKMDVTYWMPLPESPKGDAPI